MNSHSIFLYLIISFIHVISPVKSLLSEADHLLKLKQSLTFTNVTVLNSWQPGLDPCAKGKEWVGVLCHKNNVEGIRLSEMGLSGIIDVEALLQLPHLRSINLISNYFSGPIPKLNRFRALKGVYLSMNKFFGVIPPDYFAEMESLKRIWLAENNFTGSFPPSITQVPHLMSLHVENNHFTGPIPLLNQPTLKTLNLSNNNLDGGIPPGLSKFDMSSFNGNMGLCGAGLKKPCTITPSVSPNVSPTAPSPLNANMESNASNNNNNRNSNSNIIAYVAIGATVVILIVMVALIFILKQRQQKKEFEVIDKVNISDDGAGVVPISNVSKKEVEKSSGVLSRKGSSQGKGGTAGDLVMVNKDKCAFGLADLMKAAAEVLGNGASGSSYKAMMSNGLTVVVKRIKEMNKIDKDGFDAEIMRLGSLRHPNILTPLAYHYRKDEKLLVYEFLPKGSLLYILHGDRGLDHAELNWPVRLKIIQGIARGLGYLHTELASLDLPHGDLKSSNILLGPDYDPLLTDYGLSLLINSSQVPQVLAAYKSPEAAQGRLVSPKCDVYCLGVVILELLTGKFPSQYLNNGKGGTDIVQWVKSAINEGREVELFDPDISSYTNGTKEMERLLRIGAACTENNPEQRMDISEAIREIERLQVEGGQDTGRTFNVLPSLRDGYADAPAPVHQAPNEVSGKRHDSLGNQSERRTSDNFAFDIS